MMWYYPVLMLLILWKEYAAWPNVSVIRKGNYYITDNSMSCSGLRESDIIRIMTPDHHSTFNWTKCRTSKCVSRNIGLIMLCLDAEKEMLWLNSLQITHSFRLTIWLTDSVPWRATLLFILILIHPLGLLQSLLPYYPVLIPLIL